MKEEVSYINDVIYPDFFYKEMQSIWLNSILTILGFKTIDINKAFSYLELACGTGTNLIISAINNPQAKFVGIDFNEEHIKIAKKRASFIGLKNVEFLACDFETFLQTNTKTFDFIVNHGTFSWVSSFQQKVILKILARFLNDLGVFYIHYMTYPASSALRSVQKLFNLVAKQSNDSSLNKIKKAKELFFKLEEAGAFIDNPQIEAIKKTLNQDDAYLAHEFLTDYWTPLYSVDLHNMVYQNTGLNFIASANPCDNIENISIVSKMQNIIRDTSFMPLKEYLKDLARNSKQRIDIFQKNPKTLSNEEHMESINKMQFKLLPKAKSLNEIVFHSSAGEIKAPKEAIFPMIESLLKKDRTFEDLSKLKSFSNNPMFLLESIFLMMNENLLHPKNIQNPSKKEYLKKFDELMKKIGNEIKIIPECKTAIF